MTSGSLPYTWEVLSALLQAVRFWWSSTRGFRFTPWKSPYLRWRVETYTGKPADSLTLGDFWKLFVAERVQMFHYFRWLGELRAIARGKQ